MTDPWPENTAEAREIQEELRGRVLTRDALGEIRRVAGVDAAFARGGRVIQAAVAVLGFPDLQLLDHAVARLPTPFPYVPGYLSFRELPAVMESLDAVSGLPDLILADAHGYAHPRRFGLACHLGVLTDVPTIGVAKSRLVGAHEEPGEEKGAWTPLLDEDEVIGAVVRTRTRVNPVYVSVGHRVSLGTAVELTLACTTKYRIPQPIRWADRLAGE